MQTYVKTWELIIFQANRTTYGILLFMETTVYKLGSGQAYSKERGIEMKTNTPLKICDESYKGTARVWL